MALYSGVTGKISVKKGTGTAIEVMHASGWTIEKSKDIIDNAFFKNNYKEKTPDIKDWTASLDGQADFAAGNGQKDLDDAFEDGAVVECVFYLDDDTFFTGDALIESLSIEHAADGSASVSISLSGSGGVDLTVPSG